MMRLSSPTAMPISPRTSLQTPFHMQKNLSQEPSQSSALHATRMSSSAKQHIQLPIRISKVKSNDIPSAATVFHRLAATKSITASPSQTATCYQQGYSTPHHKNSITPASRHPRSAASLPAPTPTEQVRHRLSQTSQLQVSWTRVCDVIHASILEGPDVTSRFTISVISAWH